MGSAKPRATKPHTSETPQGPYRPPQKLLVPCAGCGATVLRGVCREGRVTRFDVPRSPVFGHSHQCEEPTA